MCGCQKKRGSPIQSVRRGRTPHLEHESCVCGERAERLLRRGIVVVSQDQLGRGEGGGGRGGGGGGDGQGADRGQDRLLLQPHGSSHERETMSGRLIDQKVKG